jgi:pyruvate dehydrogenase E2 component (dihydrolipoamide acetyltransferase)
MSDTMVEGVIATWQKKVGDNVKSGDVLAEVETDKAIMDLEAPESGILLHIGIEAKQAAAIDSVIAIIGKADEDIHALLAEANLASTPPSPKLTQANQPVAALTTQEPIPTTTTTSVPTLPFPPTDDRIFASPLAKKMAQLGGYDLKNIPGTGPSGRITKQDIEKIINQPPTTTSLSPTYPKGQESYELVPVSTMRKTIAARLSKSKAEAPHFYLQVSVNMDTCTEFKTNLLNGLTETRGIKITFNDIIIQAVAHALRNHPAINTAWLGDSIQYNHHIHIGVAMAIPTGLIVPVIRFADQLSLSEIALQVKTLTQKAQHNQLQPSDWEGSTFTISNLGMMNIESFTAIINPPAACILAVGSIQHIPIVKEGIIVPGHVMQITLSCDHRVVDGAVGAAFLKTLKEYLEEPLRLLV